MNILNLLLLGSNIIGGADGTTSVMVTSGLGIAVLLPIIWLIDLAEKVLFAFAAYNDARSKSNPDAVMWGLLIGFLGLIPGIIYLCVRNSGRSLTVCQNCGCSHYAIDRNCPRCGTLNQTPQYDNPYAEQQAHRAKVLLTAALVILGLGLLAAFVLLLSVLPFYFRMW